MRRARVVYDACASHTNLIHMWRLHLHDIMAKSGRIHPHTKYAKIMHMNTCINRVSYI